MGVFQVKQTSLFWVIGVWCAISIILPIFHDGLDVNFFTRILILAYFLVSLFWYFEKRHTVKITDPRKTFILWSTMNAMVVEIFHMFSKPLHHSLLITSNTSLTQGLKFTAIDLILTFPAYLLIFSVIWNLIKRYDYSPFAFFFLMALGQSLGDGNAFFVFNPMGLIFVPYIMLNYWAMNFVPYLMIRPYIIRDSAEYQRWKKFVLPIVLIPLTYVIAGGTIFIFGTLIGWLPK